MNEISLVIGNSMEEVTKKVISTISVQDFSTHYIIVPDRYSLIVENMLFDVLNIGATFNIKVLGINKIAKLIIKECGLNDFSYTKEESMLLIRSAIASCSDKFTCFKKQLSNGFCEEIFSSITQFKTNKLSIEDVKNLIEKSDLGMKEKLCDLSLIYEEYQKLLNGKLDASEVLNLFESQLENSNIVKNSYFYFVGFDSFTKQGYSLITKLAKYSKGVTTGAMFPKNQKNKFLFDNEVYDTLKNFATENKIDFKIIETYGFENEISAHIRKNLYLANPEVLKTKKQPVIITESSQIEDEVQFVVKTIKHLLFKGYNFKDINIACPIDKYKNELKNQLKKVGFDFYIDETTNIYSTYLVQAIISLIKFFGKYYENNLFDCLKNTYFFDDNEVVEKIENICLKNNIKFPYILNYDFNLTEKQEEINLLFNNIKYLFEEFKKLKNIENYIEFIKKIYKIFNFSEKLQENIKILENIDLKTQKIYVQLEKSFFEVLDTFALIKNQNISFDEFLEIFIFALKNKNINTIPLKINSIFIGDANSGFFEKREFLFIVGSNQDVIPSVLNDCGVISDKEIEDIKELYKISPTIAMINRRKRFKIYDLITHFKKTLYVSYLQVNTDGSKNFPSNFISSLSKMFTGENREYKIHYTNYDLYFESNIIDEPNFNKLVYNLTDISSSKLALSKFLKNKNYELAKLVYSAIKKDDENYNGQVITSADKSFIKDAKKLFFKNGKTKISQLESYFHCPYQHFMDYGLKLKEREDGSIQAKNIGTLLHSVAEDFCKNNKNLGNLSESEIFNSVDKIMHKLCMKDDNKWILFEENKHIYHLVKKEGKNLCIALNNQQKVSDFIPTYFEKRFFENSDFKPLYVNNLQLTGVVDRVDLCNINNDTYFRVIDYKTGKIDANYSSAYFGDKIQLFIYQRAIENSFKYKVAGNLYFSIKDKFEDKKQSAFNYEGVLLNDIDVLKHMDNSVCFDKPESDFLPFKISTSKKNIDNNETVLYKSDSMLSSQDFDDISNYVIKLSEKAINEIEEGYINTSPVKNNCKYCKYAYVCGFSTILNSKERKHSSDNVDLESFVGGENEA